MFNNSLHQIVGQTDIYLIDQIVKGRYQPHHLILDAGCGFGRNMHWFLQNNYSIYGIDVNPGSITELRLQYPHLTTERFQVAQVELMPFDDNFFHHLLSSAVLHFAQSDMHFMHMITEMMRVLQPGGTLFIRMTSDIGIENEVEALGSGVYKIPDGTTRFLLTRALLARLQEQLGFIQIEPLKTVNVQDVRCMSTLMLMKGKAPLDKA